MTVDRYGFGFTNDTARVVTLRAWVAGAVADGWVAHPTYKTEAQDRAVTLERDGFTVNVITRENVGKWKAEASWHGWGPDGLTVKIADLDYTPETWPKMQTELRHCYACGKTDVPTQRYSFAGRCCATCLPEMRKQHEQPGWCD